MRYLSWFIILWSVLMFISYSLFHNIITIICQQYSQYILIDLTILLWTPLNLALACWIMLASSSSVLHPQKRPMVDPRDLRRCPWLHGVWQRAPPASRSSEAATWLRVRAELWTAWGGKHLEKTSWKKKCVRYASGVLCFRIPQFDITQELRETTEA